MNPSDVKSFTKWADEWAKRLEENIKRLDSQIDSIESLTRENLPNFAHIFRRAKLMLDRCEDRFWMLNFTPSFGLVHSYDKMQLDDYHQLGKMREFEVDYVRAHNDLTDEVNEFTELLTSRAGTRGIIDFRLATVDQEYFRDNFITTTIEKMGPALLDPANPTQHASADAARKASERLFENHKFHLDEIKKACEGWSRRLKAKGGKPKDLHRGITILKRVPLQIFISDVRESHKQACLVFFIGDFNVKIEKRVSGFYTEQTPLVKLFEDIFESNVGHFEK